MMREMTGTVGEDCELKVAVGSHLAGRVFRVVMEEVGRPAMTQEEWVALIGRLAGSIDDPAFVRHPQG